MWKVCMIFVIVCCYGVVLFFVRCRNGYKKMWCMFNVKIVVFGVRGLRKYYVVCDFKDKNEMLFVNFVSFLVLLY